MAEAEHPDLLAGQTWEDIHQQAAEKTRAMAESPRQAKLDKHMEHIKSTAAIQSYVNSPALGRPGPAGAPQAYPAALGLPRGL